VQAISVSISLFFLFFLFLAASSLLREAVKGGRETVFATFLFLPVLVSWDLRVLASRWFRVDLRLFYAGWGRLGMSHGTGEASEKRWWREGGGGGNGWWVLFPVIIY
jgi:hypothetical protein